MPSPVFWFVISGTDYLIDIREGDDRFSLVFPWQIWTKSGLVIYPFRLAFQNISYIHC